MRIEFKNIQVQINKVPILKDVSVTAEPGKITGIIGPNGSGKSTLIKTLFSIIPYSSGTILLNGKNIRSISKKEIASQVGYVGQESSCLFDFSVRDIVAMGRFPHNSSLFSRNRSDTIVDESLSILHLEELADRSIQTLSGGEKKMVYLARTIAQQVDCIVLDEPTNHLDIQHQIFILDYLKRSGKTVLIVIHDLALAALYCDTLYLIKDGKNIAFGSPQDVLNEENIHQVFQVHGKAENDKNGICRFQLEFDK